MFYAFILFIFLTLLPLLWFTLPTYLPAWRVRDTARLRRWWGLCLSGTALWGLAIVIFSDSCLSFLEAPRACLSQLPVGELVRQAALVYVPLGGVVVPALWLAVFYVAVRRAQARRAAAGECGSR